LFAVCDDTPDNRDGLYNISYVTTPRLRRAALAKLPGYEPPEWITDTRVSIWIYTNKRERIAVFETTDFQEAVRLAIGRRMLARGNLTLIRVKDMVDLADDVDPRPEYWRIIQPRIEYAFNSATPIEIMGQITQYCPYSFRKEVWEKVHQMDMNEQLDAIRTLRSTFDVDRTSEFEPIRFR